MGSYSQASIMTQSNALKTPLATLESTDKSYEIKNLDHLGLIAAQFDDLGLVELIDSMVPQDKEKRTVSLGQSVKAMVINGLGFANHTLYLMPEFFADKPVERLPPMILTRIYLVEILMRFMNLMSHNSTCDYQPIR